MEKKISIEIGEGLVLVDDGFDSYWGTIDLLINYDKESISFSEFDNEGARSCIAPTDFSSGDYTDASVYTFNKSEFYWVINNVIDIVKEHKEQKKKSVISKCAPVTVDENKEKWQLDLDMAVSEIQDEWGLYITRHHFRGLSQHYIMGRVFIAEDYLNKLKDVMFKIKKEIKN